MDQNELLSYIVHCFEKLDIPYFITGSIASIAYGEPRLTNAIDIVADIKRDHIDEFKGCFPENDFYLEKESIKRAVKYQHQFNIIHPASGFKMDIMISKKDAFDQNRFNRIKRLLISENESANFASPEDVILKKLQYFKEGGSEKHLRDITGILRISGDMINKDYLSVWAEKLGVGEIWDSVVKKTYS
jgi:hypothetical protein